MSDQPFSKFFLEARYTSPCFSCKTLVIRGAPVRWTPQSTGPARIEHPGCYHARITREQAEKEERQLAERERIEALLREKPELMPTWKPDPDRAIDRIQAIGRSI